MNRVASYLTMTAPMEAMDITKLIMKTLTNEERVRSASWVPCGGAARATWSAVLAPVKRTSEWNANQVIHKTANSSVHWEAPPGGGVGGGVRVSSSRGGAMTGASGRTTRRGGVCGCEELAGEGDTGTTAGFIAGIATLCKATWAQ